MKALASQHGSYSPGTECKPRIRIGRSLLLFALRCYKNWISPALPAACRYVPTCSEYALEAVEHFGVFRGGLKAAWRLLRCNPFARGGLDPVVKYNPPADCTGHMHENLSARTVERIA